MKSLGHEEVRLEDVYFQLRDGLGCLGSDFALTLEHFTNPARRPYSGVFFNLLFNLNKFAASEVLFFFSLLLMSKPPHQDKINTSFLLTLTKWMQARDIFAKVGDNEPQLTEWDRFAAAEYERLAGTDDNRQGQQDGSDDSGSSSSNSEDTEEQEEEPRTRAARVTHRR